MTVKSYFKVGSLFAYEFEMRFFKEDRHLESASLLDAAFFKKIFINTAENTYSNNLMKNLNFILATQ